ncbi:tape measure protein [uncultured Oscillibacter sp.]|uniref:tape measure protein n=1 Tax=uncultured Oscillibacter sp. TaxID=876091 RepID=UPI00261DEA68|nr:tape measure protein [uncultured Oscillibacter sp.]
MATIKSQMVLNDGMSSILKKITHVLDFTIHSFEDMKRASGEAFDPAIFQATYAEIGQINEQMDKMERYYIKAAQNQDRFNKGLLTGTGHATGLTNQIGKIAAAAGAAFGVKQLFSLSDQMTSNTARLNLIVDDGGSVEALEAKIMASAQRSRAAYLDTASAIASMGANAGAAFSGNDELIAFMEQVNKQFVIGGASAQGQSAAMLQLTQAMAAGALRGEELNSILENAPGIARAIESYMGIAEGSIKQYAQEGAITAEVVKNALFAAADETNAKFESMPMTWGQIWTSMQNRALTVLDPILTKLNGIANNEQFSTVADGALQAFSVIASVATVTLDAVFGLGAAIVDNWSWIEPIVWGVVTVMGIYQGIVLALAIAEGIKTAATTAATFSENAHAAALAMSTGATFSATVAQYGLNAALYACPITWIVLAIIALIAVFYAAVAAVNHFAGTSLSATGIICGAFAVAGAFIINLILGVVNFVIGIGVEIYNLIATFANFFANVFNDPVGAIINLFAGMFDFILGIVQSAASLIDTVLGTDMSGAVAGFRNTVATKVEEIVGEQVEVMQKLDASDYQIQRIEYGDAWAAGNSFGQGIEDTVGGLFSGFSTDPSNMGADLGGGGAGYVPYDELSKGVGDISDNTGSMAKSLEVSGEELEYLRDIAERDAINRFTTAEVKIDMTGMTNKIDGGADLDGVIRELTDGFTEALVTAAEGVHA